MYEPFESNKNNNLPSKNKFARTFRILSRISYWIHIILGAISALTLLLVVFSRDASNSTGTGVAVYEREQVIEIADLLLILAELNILDSNRR